MNEIYNHEPLVSVVIPCYNHSLYVRECILSVVDQDYKNIELIIIDDGSSDTSIREIEAMCELCESRFIRFMFVHRENRGLCNTLNEALEWCEGRYYSALASDDIWLSFKISRQVKYLELHPEAVAVFGGVTLIDELGRVLRKVEKKGSFGFKQIFLSRYFLPAPTALVRRQELRKIGYDPGIKIEDWNIWLKLSKITGKQLVSLGDSVTLYRKHANSMSDNDEMMYREGKKILSQFNDDADYDQALAEYELAMSRILAFSDKRKSIRHFLAFLKSAKYSRRALPVLIKILIPSVFSGFMP